MQTERVGAEPRMGAVEVPMADGSASLSAPSAPHALLSWSRYTTVTNCLRSFKLKYIDQVPQRPQGAQLGGKTVHEVIEKVERERWMDIEAPGEFVVRWAEVLREHENIRWSGRTTKEYPNGEDADWWFKQGPRMLDNYFWLREQDEAIGRKLMQGPNGPVIEARVLMDIGGASSLSTSGEGASGEDRAVPVTPESTHGSAATAPGPDGDAPPILWQGYLDRMMVDDEGPLVDDLKCGRQTQAYSVFQLADYALAWTRTTGEIVTRGRVVNLRHRKAPEILDLTKAIETTEARYRDLAQTIEIHRESGVWPASPSSFCVSCSVKAACDIGSVLYPEES